MLLKFEYEIEGIMVYYDYPPSAHILNRCDSPIVNNSHYFVSSGTIELKNGKELPSSFEIAFTQENKIVIICYSLEPSHFWELQIQDQQVAKIYGLEVRKQRNILVEEPQYRFGDGLSGYFVFSGNPLFSVEYLKSYPTVLTNDRLSKFSISGFRFPFGYSNIISSGKHEITFSVQGSSKAITLGCLLENKAKITFKNQRTGRLRVQANIASDWGSVQIVDWWTKLVSIATGHDVVWLHCMIPRNDNAYCEEQWMSRISLSLSQPFLGAIIPSHLKTNNIKDLQEFVNISLDTILDSGKSPEDWSEYLVIAAKYIDYCSSRVTMFGQVRMVTTLVEELLGIWRSHRGITKKESFILRLEKFFQFYGHDTSVKVRLKDRIEAFIGTRNSVVHAGTFQCNNPELKVRNKQVPLFKNSSNPSLNEYKNSLMILPLMLFCILGYQGKYNDFVFGEHQYWTP